MVDPGRSFHVVIAGYTVGLSSRHLGADGIFKQGNTYWDAFLASEYKLYLLEP